MENQAQKNTHGGARPGAGRKRQDTEPRRATMAISGTKTELETIRQKAKASGKTTSRFLIELALEERRKEVSENKKKTKNILKNH